MRYRSSWMHISSVRGFESYVLRLRVNGDIVAAYRASHYPLHPPPLASDPRETYHSLHPHPALSPVPISLSPDAATEQQKNEAAYRRLLVQGVLAVLLPTEDLENGCLRTLVREI